jgi:HSP20 family protein
MRDLQRTFDEFDRLFENFYSTFGSGAGTSARPQASSSTWVPAYELQENPQGYLLSFDLPGIPKNEVKIELKENQLRVSGERKKAQTSTDTEGRVYSERRYGFFERTFMLPNDVDVDKIQAHHEDGVLHLMLPKTERVKAKTIEIQSGPMTGGFFSKLVGKDKASGSGVQ